MRREPEVHLSPDDLDALLAGAARAAVLAHLVGCPSCRMLAANDRAVIVALAQLPKLEPSPGFADRVLARAARPDSSEARSILRLPRVWTLPRLARAAALTLVVLGGMGGSVAWSLANAGLLQGWRQQALRLLDGWLWSLQSWGLSLGGLLEAPGRIALFAAGFVALYTAGLFAFRRLVALPSRRLPNAV